MPKQNPIESEQLDYDAIVIGAGVGGIYAMKCLVDLGLRGTVLDRNADLGGTWYNNRYPGCRFDSESYTYGYTFSRELMNEWRWKENFSPQPDNLEYLQFVANKFDLYKYMQFNCNVQSAHFDEAGDFWKVMTADGREMTTRYVIFALGLLCTPTYPRLEGMDEFKGESFHTFDWPHDPVELAGKRVAVVGTGATGIQVIAEIADKVDSLTVFQRRPNWSAPLNNSPISDEQWDDIRSRWDEIVDLCSRTPGSFIHQVDRRRFWEVTPEERKELWDKLYDEPGFGIWLSNFPEIFTDEKANEEFSSYIADRIRGRVDDPVTAEKLIPRDHGFGVQRVPLETNYFEVYNRDNVNLVDIQETPIERITERGIQTSDQEREFDIIVYATGFNAIVGAYDKIDIRGINGVALKDKWANGPSTFLGILVEGFPNLLMPSGPQSGSASTNYPRGIQNGVDWCSGLLDYAREQGATRLEPTLEAQEKWTQHVIDVYSVMLMRKAKSWFTGYNSNVEGHEYGKTHYLVYNAGTPKYLSAIREVSDNEYRGVLLDGSSSRKEL